MEDLRAEGREGSEPCEGSEQARKLEITGAGIKLREGESGFTFGLWLKELEGEGGVDCD